MKDKVLIWLDSRPLISINRLCKMVGYDMANFKKSTKRGHVPQKIRESIVEILSEYGYSDNGVVSSKATQGSFDGSKVDIIKFDEFRVPSQPTKRYTILDYNQRIFDATGFEQDLKQVENDIRNDIFLTTQQRLILLRSMGLNK